ncbi:MAG TPA: FmdB family zinc ribbon protein [Dehalococcoidia bacterium]|nr:FmdB family zinc ribbon protein [Dehalococcoidia bacterium]
MPTYEYACDSCGKRYEKREGFDAPARQKCQHCGKMASRVLFAPPVVFKGSGFYKTDSRGTSSAAADSGSGGGGSSSAATPAKSEPTASTPPDTKTTTTESAAAG